MTAPSPITASIFFLRANYPPDTVPQLVLRLESKFTKSGISLLPPSKLAPRLQRLPPMLHILSPDPVPRYSKAPRGLFVLLRETRIFTGTSISPSPSLRQRPSCYTIRAGRNLPDKGFRYLRTVIVTAAVHWGFGSQLRITPNHSP